MARTEDLDSRLRKVEQDIAGFKKWELIVNAVFGTLFGVAFVAGGCVGNKLWDSSIDNKSRLTAIETTQKHHSENLSEIKQLVRSRSNNPVSQYGGPLTSFGTVSRITKEAITLEWEGGGYTTESTFSLSPNVTVLINGERTSLSDIMPGVKASSGLQHDEGRNDRSCHGHDYAAGQSRIKLQNAPLPFFGGGIVAVLLNWIKESRSRKREQRISYLQEQLRLLYGPLHFFATQNHEFLQQAGNIRQASDREFAGKEVSELGRQTRTEQIEKAIELENTWVTRIPENNKRIMQALETNWSLIDIDDFDPFSKFRVHFVRLEVEVQEEGTKGLPVHLRKDLGAIHFMPPDFSARATEKWNAKRKELSKLLKSK